MDYIYSVKFNLCKKSLEIARSNKLVIILYTYISPTLYSYYDLCCDTCVLNTPTNFIIEITIVLK